MASVKFPGTSPGHPPLPGVLPRPHRCAFVRDCTTSAHSLLSCTPPARLPCSMGTGMEQSASLPEARSLHHSQESRSALLAEVPMIRNILVPLDGSAFGEQALPLALSIAR